jgi:hypothetical protein
MSLTPAKRPPLDQDGDVVLALPMAAAADAAAPAAAHAPPGASAAVPGWRAVLPEAQGAECLQADHWRDDAFLLIVDDGGAPDGRVELVTAPAAAAAAARGAARPARRRQAIVGGDDDGSSSDSGSSSRRSSGSGEGGVEVKEFALSAGHAAVAVRRGGVCEVLIYDLEAAAAAAPDVQEGGSRGGSDSDRGSGGGGSSGEEGARAPLPAPARALTYGEGSTTVIALSSLARAPGGGSGSSGPGGGAREAVRLSEQSMVSPERVYDLDPVTGAKALVFEEAMAPDFDAGRYQSRMEWTASHDGVKVRVGTGGVGGWGGMLCVWTRVRRGV